MLFAQKTFLRTPNIYPLFSNRHWKTKMFSLETFVACMQHSFCLWQFLIWIFQIRPLGGFTDYFDSICTTCSVIWDTFRGDPCIKFSIAPKNLYKHSWFASNSVDLIFVGIPVDEIWECFPACRHSLFRRERKENINCSGSLMTKLLRCCFICQWGFSKNMAR